MLDRAQPVGRHAQLDALPSASEIKVTFCRFGRNVRLVLLLAWETLLPTCRPLPVSSQTRDMVFILILCASPHGARRAPPVNGSGLARQCCPTRETAATRWQYLALGKLVVDRRRSVNCRGLDHAGRYLRPDRGRPHRHRRYRHRVSQHQPDPRRRRPRSARRATASRPRADKRRRSTSRPDR